MTHHCFLVPVLDKWLLHAPLSGVTALVNRRVAEALRTGEDIAEAAALRECIASTDAALPQARTGDVCPSFLGITPTRGCNIGCVYCNFGGPTAPHTTMDLGIAVSAVDWMADTLSRHGRRDFQIHFFGGEPFYAPEVIDVVVHRARYRSAQLGLELYVDASTNGVFGEERCQFVGDYFGGVVLSFDGPPEFHNRNRPSHGGKPTFEAVSRTAKRLSGMPLDLCIRMCVTQDAVMRLEEITKWFAAEYSPAVINFESLTPGELARAANLTVPNPFDFARHCFGSYRVARELGIRAVYSAAEFDRPRTSFCPVGTDALIVSMDGRTSGCYLLPEDWRARGLDMDVGWVRPNGQVDFDLASMQRVREVPMKKERCQKCFCQWSCAGGCHVNQTYPGCASDYTDFCIQTRLLTALLLLDNLDKPEIADRLLADESALRRLGFHAKDTVMLDCTTTGVADFANVHGSERERIMTCGQ
jgi:uncharacterized protein